MTTIKMMARRAIGSVVFSLGATALVAMAGSAARAQSRPVAAPGSAPSAGPVEIYDPQTGTATQAPPFPYTYPPGHQPPAAAASDPELSPDEQAALQQEQLEAAQRQADEQAQEQAQEGQAQQDQAEQQQQNAYGDGVQPYGTQPPDLGPDQAVAESYDDGYDPGAYTQFEAALDPYGSWVDDASYGHVWVPSSAVVGAGFVPYYTSGHWVLTEYGWTWVSNWDWGWAPFHYGRWAMLHGRGWGWVPGTMWGPAWVSWRSGGGYVGWAPLPPRGAAIPASFGGRGGWHFATANQLGATRLVCAGPRAMPGLFARTTVVANDRLLSRGTMTVHVNAGPMRGFNAQPVRLASAVPRVLPRLAVLPHRGEPLAARPWARLASVDAAGAHTTARPSGPAYQAGTSGFHAPDHQAAAPSYHQPAYQPSSSASHQPAYQAPATAPRALTYQAAGNPYHAPANQPAAPAYRPYQSAAPAYRPPAPAYQPTAPAYHAPAYRAAPPVYGAPVYQRTAPAYRAAAPAAHYGGAAYHAPAYSAPAYSPPVSRPPAYQAPAYQAPAFRASAPAFAPAAAPAHFGAAHVESSGGAHFGGGRRR